MVPTAQTRWPAFRVVAETEHLPTAAEMVGVTPPALSRAVQQLEYVLGVQLFVRSGRKMTLNDDGRQLLSDVRQAMRGVHSAIEEITHERFTGLFRWTSSWSTSQLVVDTLAGFIEDHPKLTPQMHAIEASDSVPALLRGELDLALVAAPVAIDELVCEHVGDLPHGVYCGPTHTLHGKSNLSLKELAKYGFAAPVASREGTFADGWPHDKPRQVIMQFARMEAGFQACHAGHCLAVFPKNVAKGLWCLHDLEAVQPVYTIYRSSEIESPASSFAAALIARFQATSG